MSDYDNCSTLDEAIEIWKQLDPISERTISGKAEALILQATKDETLIPVVCCKDCVYRYYAVDCAGMCKLRICNALLDDDFCSRGIRKSGAKMEVQHDN